MHIVSTQKGTPDPDAPHVIEEMTYECVVDRTKLKSDEQKGVLAMSASMEPSAGVVRAILGDAAAPSSQANHAFTPDAILEATKRVGYLTLSVHHELLSAYIVQQALAALTSTMCTCLIVVEGLRAGSGASAPGKKKKSIGPKGFLLCFYLMVCNYSNKAYKSD